VVDLLFFIQGNEIFPDGKVMLLRSDVRLTASDVASQ
jgi:hypothetical protein